MAVKGILDLTNWDLAHDGAVSLSGEYEFYWQQLLNQNDFQRSPSPLKTGFVAVPHIWNPQEFPGIKISGDGYATYRLKVLLNGNDADLAIKIKEVGTSFNLFINGRSLSAGGTVGKSADSARPGFNPEVIEFQTEENFLDITLQVSNFSHKLGGAWESIVLGTRKQLQKDKELNIALDLFLIGGILIMALYHFGLFSLRRMDRSSLFFGFFCLIMVLRILTTGDRYLVQLFPGISYEIAIKFEYLTFYLAVPAFSLYFYSLFSHRYSKTICSLTVGIGLAFSSAVILLPVRLFSHTLTSYQLFTVTIFFIAIVALVTASLRKETRAIIFLSGFMALFLASLNDILHARGVIHTGYIVQFGLFIFIFSQAYLLSRNFSKAFTTIEAQRQKLEETNRAVMMEIRERKQAEKGLRESHERFLTVLDSIDANVYVADMDTYEILFMNQHMKDDYKDDFTRQICWQVFRNGPGPCGDCTKHRLLNPDGRPTSGYVQESRDSITGRWYSIYDRAIKWDHERFARLKVATDITERKLAEVTLQETNDKLEKRVRERTADLLEANDVLREEIEERKRAQEATRKAKTSAEIANNAKSEFLANMSHELRTPLNHIIGFTELVLDKNFGDLNDQQEEYLNDVHRSSNHLLSLINDILDLSKIDSGKLELSIADINLEILLESSLAMVKEKAITHAIQFSTDLKCLPGRLKADERKIKQVMYNLLSNAVKFTPNGGNISISTERWHLNSTSNGNGNKDNGVAEGVKISVHDSGIGINPNDLERIFNPFEQVDQTATRRFQGTGLGLSLSKKFIELHSGKIWAESTGEGNGSAFHFILPLE